MADHVVSKVFRLAISIFAGLLGVAALLFFLGRQDVYNVLADPIPPEEGGYPKLSLSTKVVTPTLTGTGGETLQYVIEIVNTGAYMAENVTLEDQIPNHTSYKEDAVSSVSPAPGVDDGVLTWNGTVGFDASVLITFSVDVESEYFGVISNTAVISQPMIPEPVSVTAEATVTNDPILVITKTSSPDKPGAGKPLTYELTVTNLGQSAVDLPVKVVDVLPADTTYLTSPDGELSQNGKEVTWDRTVSLEYQESSVFTFSVTIDSEVISGTVINNADYYVESIDTGISAGEPYTVTVIDPILYISKDVEPYPPGSNRDMTYILTVLNKGSLATNLTVTDVVPDNVDYVSGGTYQNGTVSWPYPSLDTDETAQFTYTVYIDDIAEVDILNQDYEVCSLGEGVCAAGELLSSVVQGPTFLATAELYPIAKKPGGGGGPVTPTLTVENIGPGYAKDAMVTLYFERISVSGNDLEVIPIDVPLDDGPDCGDKCVSYVWVGDIGVGEIITFTTIEGQSTIGGEEGTNYTATLVISDSLGAYTTDPITATAIGTVTHYANLIPTKSAPAVVGAGQTMTYTIEVWNSGLSTDDPVDENNPSPLLVETLPVSVSLEAVSDDGVAQTIGDQTVISWTLPAMSPGDRLWRSFSVLVGSDLLSGTKIINDDYHTLWHEDQITETMYISNTGQPITTVVKEVGLIDSFKTVTPTLARPGPTNVLTYVVHVVNSSLNTLYGVEVEDLLPWEHSTYQRDAVASSGEIVESDIVSIHWVGDVAPLSSEHITLTVNVDPDYEGPLTNTAWIRHESLQEDVLLEAVAYITDDPVLQITKSAAPDPVRVGNELLYTIKVINLGQQATNLMVWDTIPENTTYVAGSASSNGKLIGNQVQWQLLELAAEATQQLTFRVEVGGGDQIINDDYGVTCPGCEPAYGQPVVTDVRREGTPHIYLPLIFR
jgi:uncharacterized repeat protein (TIGR01451 family)